MVRRIAAAMTMVLMIAVVATGCVVRITPPPQQAPEAPVSDCADGEVRDADGTCIPASVDDDEPQAGGDSAIIIATDPSACTVPAGVDFEGYFDESGMLDVLDCAVPAVDGWIDTVYSGMPHPQYYLYIPEGVTVETSCITPDDEYEPADDTAAFYCPADENVYLGHRTMWEFYDGLGDGSVFMAIAHEVTHHFQSRVGTYEYLAGEYGAPLPPQATRLAENQADCGSGAFVAYEDRQGLLDPEDDIEDLARVLEAIASSEDDPDRDHGDLTERTQSFDLGFTSEQGQPLFECNAIIDGVPLIE